MMTGEPALEVGASVAPSSAGSAATEDLLAPKPPYSWSGPAPLKVRFRQRVDRAAIDLMLSAARESATIRTEHLACPYQAIMHWLEAVAIGVHECACFIESSGVDLRLGFERHVAGEGILRVEDCYSKARKPIFAAKVDRAQMVKALYRGFVRFTESPGYNPFEYEDTTVGERIEFATEGRFTGHALLDLLVYASPHEVQDVFETGCPLGMWDTSEAISKKERWPRLWRAMCEMQEGKVGPWPIVYKSRWSEVVSTLTGKTPDRRRELIKDWLAESAGWLRGGRLRTLRSSIIERFLVEQCSAESNSTAAVFPISVARCRRTTQTQEGS